MPHPTEAQFVVELYRLTEIYSEKAIVVDREPMVWLHAVVGAKSVLSVPRTGNI
jgi:hypothetical protein|uniref:Uncharacterized protein n=1 Tax=Oryza sativa subsp. japonica TaxID=39947 RepID=Q6YUB2_ORYSJ|nr:hypothetical protein [Oryza sativa Japonica Group]BAD10688.1 hypothetical protein [Oryza sativa Japonica Group]